MFYTIYKITNQIDGKFYIGSHKTKDLNDSYMGSGKYLIHAQKKYGIENFKKEILFVFETADEMYAKEAEIVNEDFLATENTYNLKIGGHGGWDYLNDKDKFDNPTHRRDHMKMMSDEGKEARQKKLAELHKDPGWKSEFKKKSRESQIRRVNSPEYVPGFLGKTHTEETKKKMSDSLKITSAGERNSQYGTRWIHSLERRVSKKISKDAPLPEGWVEGRKMKFLPFYP